ncbi:hypothetical protein ACJ73_06970 [Blastomyces percursus]|uniref:Uncharacterized protein n=1 Tax=Blastomyces percursus TaxID=1658174 RepID=A0A1J9PZE4_9EURO|nr:hypothetical protein ACJ73_06970 [Blastomyces percursus]
MDPPALSLGNMQTYLVQGEVQGLRFREYTFLTVAVTTAAGVFAACTDTGSGISLIDEAVRQKYFDDVQVQMLPAGQHLGLKGIGGRDATLGFIPHHVAATNSYWWRCNIIIANDALRPADAVIDVAGDRITFRGTEVVEAQSRTVPVRSATIKPTPTMKRRVAVRAAGAAVVQPGFGTPIPIARRDLSDQDVWQFRPLLRKGQGHMFAGAPHALISHQQDILPYANLGDIPVKIIKGQILGYAERVDSSMLAPTGVMVSLATVEDDIPNPFEVPPLDDEATVAEADVSDHWGPEYQDKVRQLLRSHAPLFSTKLGMFNDGVHMPIRFYDEANLGGLKTKPYHWSKRDREAGDPILDKLLENGRIEKVPLGATKRLCLPSIHCLE